MEAVNLVAEDMRRYEAPSRPVHQTIPRLRLSYGDFYHDFAEANLPCIIEGAIDHWPAMRKWTPEYFAQTYPDKELMLRDLKTTTRLDDFVQSVGQATPDKPSPYLRNIHIRTDFPELLADIDQDLIFSRPDYLNSRLLPKDWIRPNHQIELFFGGVGTQIFTLHYDIYLLHNLIIGIYGEKEFVMLAPEDTQYLYPKSDNDKHSPINVFEPDLEAFPDYAKANPMRGTLGPGDIAFVPAGWWHMTRIKSTSISVGMCSVNASNWSYFVQDVRPKPAGAGGSLAKWLVLKSYLESIGWCFRARQKFFNLIHGAANKQD